MALYWRKSGDTGMDWWDWLAMLAIAVYIFTWRGFGPIGQPRNPPFPIWPKVWERLRRLIYSS
jgi:hypothetical protein